MYRNYVKIAVRNLGRHPGYAFINAAGLAVGLACCVLIFLFVRNELAVNTVFEHVDRLYRVDSEWRESTMGLPLTTLAPVGETMVEAYPEVVDQVRMYLMSATVRHGRESLRRDAMVADPSVLRMFGLPLLYGDAATALDEPRSVVIHEDLARTLFGRTDVLGEPITLESWNAGDQVYTVTGVWQALPFNSITRFGDSHYQLILPPPPGNQDFVGAGGWTSWDSRYILIYVRLAPGADAAALQERLGGFVEAYAPEAYHGNLNLRLHALRTLYLDDGGNLGWRTVLLLSSVAVLVLLIAGINFMNLTTAQSLRRAREVGIRKVLGSGPGQVAGQFLGEAILVCLLATGLGAALAAVGAGPFFAFAQKEVVLPRLWDGVTAGWVLGIALATGVLAGSYPALFLARFAPARALKGRVPHTAGSRRLRQALVVAQFAAAVVLLVAVYTIGRQMDFIMNKDLGYDKENVLVIHSVPRDWTPEGLARLDAVKARLREVPGVQAVSLGYDTPTMGSFAGNTLPLRRPDQGADEALSLTFFRVDESYAGVYGMPLRAGRFFSRERPADLEGVVINQAAVEALGLEEAVDAEVVVGDSARVRVVGVLEDFHFASLHEPIRPLAFIALTDEDPLYRLLSVRLAPGPVGEAVGRVRAAWGEVLPTAPFEHTFLDADLDRLYRTEQQVRQVVGAAAGLAVLIACLGMLGLAALSVVQRTREIGVRRAFGASVPTLVLLLTRDFTRPVVLAVLIATPLAYLVMDRWLVAFAYRQEVGWAVFVAAGLGVLALALLTVGYHTVTAARANPADTLRYE